MTLTTGAPKMVGSAGIVLGQWSPSEEEEEEEEDIDFIPKLE